MSSRFPLLEGVPSIQALVEDPQYAQKRAEFESYPGHQVPDVSVRADAAPGPHGAVPVRVYHDGAGDGSRPCLVWMHGGAFMMGNLDMPEADWAARELAKRADAMVVSVDYRLCHSVIPPLSAEHAALLREVPDLLVMVTSMLHGFLNLPASIGPVGSALDLIAETLRVPAGITG